MAIPDIVSTGIRGLDQTIHSLRKGDNVVLQVDDLESYLHFVKPYIKNSQREKRNLVYIRFAKHAPILEKSDRVRIYELDAVSGFDAFSKQIHDIITKEGAGAFYVFDCLSDLLSAWATDLMIGNFFMVTCPYLFKLDTIAYFAILRNNHSYKTIARIRETTQLLIDIYNFEGNYYIHPLKVWNRYSPTMFLPHKQEKEEFVPLDSSVDATRLFSYINQKSIESAKRNLDYWDNLFLQAKGLAQKPDMDPEKRDMLEKLSRIMIGHEQNMLNLAKENFVLEDLLDIKSRMIGTGFIGGKTVGMLLSRKILNKDKKTDWDAILEPHDSFYIGSDVFYTYIVENGWWELWLEQKTKSGYFSKAAELREKMLTGKFPEEIREQFHQIIEYFGQSPIIIRSSSLLEDSFGNAFAGKYESFFCVNQGSPEERYQHFKELVRRVFASTVNEDAICYRLQRGLSQMNEEMALLVQRVSGRHYQKYFFPYVAGVGFSYNTFVWHEKMDPAAGMLRIVYGLGTRAVNRVEGDYPRIVALDHPLMRPYAGMEKLKRFSQHEVDLLDIKQNTLETVSLNKLIHDEPGLELGQIGSRDLEAEKKLKELGINEQSWVLTFDDLLSKTEFTQVIRQMLKTLEENYKYPVDIEYTINYSSQNKMQINLLQCRPLQAIGSGGQINIPEDVEEAKLVLSSIGNFMGGSVDLPIKRLIYVDPAVYQGMVQAEKYEIARIIGRINREMTHKDDLPTLLIGPGRWGSRDPSLGVPVKFAEINNIAALVEVADPDIGFMPELSFGSHFFLDLVETQIFYLALFPSEENVFLDKKWLNGLSNILSKLIPEAADYEEVLMIHDFKKKPIKLFSDITSRKVICLK